MNDEKKTKQRLIKELAEARARAAQLEALEKEYDLLSAFMDSVPDHIFFKDRGSRFTKVNRAQAQAFGLDDPSEAIAKTDFDFFLQEDAQRFYEGERRVLETGQPVIGMEWQVPGKDGETLWRSVTRVALVDESGQVIGLVGISRDVTAQKEIEERNVRLQQEVLDAHRATLQELSTPIIPVVELADTGSIIVMPLIGSIDTLRAKDITRKLLAGIREHQAKVVILDITGVPVVDSGVAAHLNKTIQTARLKGARTIVTGVSEAVAETIVDLGIDWSGIETLSDLQTGLVAALKALGFRLVRSG